MSKDDHSSLGRKTPNTRETQYQECIEAVDELGFERMGLRSSQNWHDDPKHLLFRFSRYIFVAKMLAGSEHVLENGCGDAFGTRLVQQEVKALSATDFDDVFVEDVKARMVERWRFPVFTHDLLSGPIPSAYDVVFSLDVLEHISSKDELTFLKNAFAPLTAHGVGIIGMPSLKSQLYASPTSRAAHVNCKIMPDLKKSDAGSFPQRFHVFHERRVCAYRAPSHRASRHCARCSQKLASQFRDRFYDRLPCRSS